MGIRDGIERLRVKYVTDFARKHGLLILVDEETGDQLAPQDIFGAAGLVNGMRVVSVDPPVMLARRDRTAVAFEIRVNWRDYEPRSIEEILGIEG